LSAMRKSRPALCSRNKVFPVACTRPYTRKVVHKGNSVEMRFTSFFYWLSNVCWFLTAGRRWWFSDSCSVYPPAPYPIKLHDHKFEEWWNYVLVNKGGRTIKIVTSKVDGPVKFVVHVFHYSCSSHQQNEGNLGASLVAALKTL